MDNIHGIENALNIEYLDPGFVSAMQKAWCYETAYDGCKTDYLRQNPELDAESDAYITGLGNPSLGNCFLTTLVAWAAGGYADHLICGEKGGVWHWRLVAKDAPPLAPLDEKGRLVIDPTDQQFLPEDKFAEAEKGNEKHMEIVHGSIFEPMEAERLQYRLGVFLELMNDRDSYDTGYTACEIIDRLRDYFRYAQNYGINPQEHVMPRTDQGDLPDADGGPMPS